MLSYLGDGGGGTGLSKVDEAIAKAWLEGWRTVTRAEASEKAPSIDHIKDVQSRLAKGVHGGEGEAARHEEAKRFSSHDDGDGTPARRSKRVVNGDTCFYRAPDGKRYYDVRQKPASEALADVMDPLENAKQFFKDVIDGKVPWVSPPAELAKNRARAVHWLYSANVVVFTPAFVALMDYVKVNRCAPDVAVWAKMEREHCVEEDVAAVLASGGVPTSTDAFKNIVYVRIGTRNLLWRTIYIPPQWRAYSASIATSAPWAASTVSAPPISVSLAPATRPLSPFSTGATLALATAPTSGASADVVDAAKTALGRAYQKAEAAQRRMREESGRLLWAGDTECLRALRGARGEQQLHVLGHHLGVAVEGALDKLYDDDKDATAGRFRVRSRTAPRSFADDLLVSLNEERYDLYAGFVLEIGRADGDD